MRIYFYRVRQGRADLIGLLDMLKPMQPTDLGRQVRLTHRLTRLQELRKRNGMYQMDLVRGKDVDLPGKADEYTDVEDLEIDPDESVFERSAIILYGNTLAIQFQPSIRWSTLSSYLSKASDELDVELDLEVDPTLRDDLVEQILNGRFGPVRNLEVAAVAPPSYHKGETARDVRRFLVAHNEMNEFAVTVSFSAGRGDILNQSETRRYIRTLLENRASLRKLNVKVADWDEPFKLLNWQYQTTIRNDTVDKTPGRQLDFDSRIHAMIEHVRRMGPQV